MIFGIIAVLSLLVLLLWPVAILALVATVLLLLWHTPAHAEPISLLTTVLVSLLSAAPYAITAPIIASIGITAFAQLVSGALVLGGLVAANFLLGQRPNAPVIDPGQLKETFTGEESPEINAIGRVRVSGVLLFGNTATVNRYRVIGHCKGEIDGIENTYLGGQEVVLFDDGLVASPPYVSVPDEDSYVEIHDKPGDGTETAWADLIAEFPTLWTSDHRIRGIAQSLARYKSPGFTNADFVRLYQSGPPRLERVLRAQKLYDPRIDDTKWSDNGILAALHVLLTWPEFSIDDFDLDFIGDEADRADELVEVFGGGSPAPTEKRARAWGFWSSETPRADVMAQLLRSIGAEIVPRPNDKLGIALIDDERTPEASIELRHIVDLSWRSGPESVERPNLCRLKYYSPERGYEMTEILLHEFDEYAAHLGPSWARVQDEIDRVGEKPIDIDLPFCPSAAQAQRIARRLFTLARADVGVATTNQVGLAVWGTRAIEIEFPDEIGTKTVALGPPRVLDDRGQVELPFIVWPEFTAWDPATDEVAAPEQMPDLASGDPLDAPDPPDEAVVVTNADGTFTRVAVPAWPGGVARGEGSYRTRNAEDNPNPWIPFGFPVSPAPSIFYIEEDLDGITIEARTRGFASGDERGSQWSEIVELTPAFDPTAPGTPSIDATAGIPNSISATAPSDLNVAYMEFTGPDAPVGQIPVTPGEIVSWESASNGTWTAQAFATGGAGSAIASDTLP